MNLSQSDGSAPGCDGRRVARTQGVRVAQLRARPRTQSTRRPARPGDTRLRFETSSKTGAPVEPAPPLAAWTPSPNPLRRHRVHRLHAGEDVVVHVAVEEPRARVVR